MVNDLDTPSEFNGTWGLTPTAAKVMQMIAAGHSYEQIITAHPPITYLDIQAAAKEALAMASRPNLSHIRTQHPRAYDKWTPEEEEHLRQLFAAGNAVGQIASVLQRQPSAIQSRLMRLGILNKPNKTS